MNILIFDLWQFVNFDSCQTEKLIVPQTLRITKLASVFQFLANVNYNSWNGNTLGINVSHLVN